MPASEDSPSRLPERIYLFLVLFSICGSVLSRFTGLEPGPIAPGAAALTLLVGVFAAMGSTFRRLSSVRALSLFAGVLAVGAGSEVLSLYTGFPFGSYAYTRNWWPTVVLPGEKPFPLLLPFAWLLMAGSAYRVLLLWAGRFMWPAWTAIPLGAALATLLDVPMEPVMVYALAYWQWTPPGPLPGGAPWMNPFGWFLTSLVAGTILYLGGHRSSDDPVPLRVLAGHMALIAALGAVHWR
jgi:putative membrane protein